MFKGKTGQSFIEYAVLVTLILITFLYFQKYIVRAFSGQWKQAGDSWGQGKQYDPKNTVECAYDYQFSQGWYKTECYYNKKCQQECFDDEDECKDCIASCITQTCNN